MRALLYWRAIDDPPIHTPMPRSDNNDALNEAVELHRNGRLGAAEKIYRQVLAEQPQNADALHLLGLIASANGRNPEAAELIGKAISLNPGVADFHNNLGNALFALGQLATAELSFHESIRLDPDIADYYGNLGRLLQHLRRWSESEAAYRKALNLRAAPEYAAGLGNALLAQGRARDAEQVFRDALARKENSAELTANLAGSLIVQQRLDEAAEVCRRALAIDPNSPSVLHAWGQILALRGDHPAAIDCFERARAAQPENPDISLSAASSLIALQRWAAAERALRAVVAAQPRLLRARYALARVMIYRGRPEQAIALLDEAGEAAVRDVEGFRVLALAQRGAGQHELAAETLRSAIRHDPAAVSLYLTLGNVLQDSGDPGAAIDAFADALRHDPGCAEARVQIAACKRYDTLQNPDVKAIELRLDNSSGEDETQGLHFALAKIMADCGEFARSWEHVDAANELRGRGSDFDRDALAEQVELLREVCSREWIERFSGKGSDSELPVFVVGMPQAGASLLDRLLSDHPGIGSVGGWDGIERLSKSVSRKVIDKYPRSIAALNPDALPELAKSYLLSMGARSGVGDVERVCHSANGNIMYLGMIAALFPRARILHCRRDARDTCLANFFQPYAGQNDFTSDLEDLASCYRAYDAAVAQWRDIGIEIREVSFERLVEKPERTLRAVLKYLGLKWDGACLDYFASRHAGRHHDFWRLEQPFYAKTPGHWKRYKKHLGVLTDALAGRNDRVQ